MSTLPFLMPKSEKRGRGEGDRGPSVVRCGSREVDPTLGLILVAEDREDDVLLIQRAFREGNLLNPLHVVSNGEETILYLSGQGKYAHRDEYPLPALVLLDLKMPRKDGFEVLHWIRHQPELSGLRVVVLTASDEVRDVNRAYQLGANSFLVKPIDFPSFVEMTRALKGYWLWMSEQPEVSRPVATRKKKSKTELLR